MTTQLIGSLYFVTSANLPFFPGRGGTEAFVFGHIRELRRRGIDAGIVSVGLTEKDGRHLVPDIPFIDVKQPEDLCKLDAFLACVSFPFAVPTKKPMLITVHIPPLARAFPLENFKAAVRRHTLVANSRFTRDAWAEALDLNPDKIPIVYPFADPAFAAVKRVKQTGPPRILFAGRLHIAKGIYLLLEALHHPVLKDFRLTVTTAGKPTDDTRILAALLRQHPKITLTEGRTSPQATAALMAEHDILIMPSNHHFWQEAFGMLSVEAQHAGCRVVAADTGGLPETDLGSLYLFEPGNSYALAQAIAKAHADDQVKASARKRASEQFTLTQSVDSLLAVLQQKLKFNN